MSKFQMSSCWFEVKLMTSFIIQATDSKTAQRMILPTPCLTDGSVVLGLETSPLFLQTYLLSSCPDSSVFVSSDHQTFLQKVFGSSLWAAVPSWSMEMWNYCGHDAGVPEASSSRFKPVRFETWWFLDCSWTSFLPSEGGSWVSGTFPLFWVLVSPVSAQTNPFMLQAETTSNNQSRSLMRS